MSAVKNICLMCKKIVISTAGLVAVMSDYVYKMVIFELQYMICAF